MLKNLQLTILVLLTTLNLFGSEQESKASYISGWSFGPGGFCYELHDKNNETIKKVYSQLCMHTGKTFYKFKEDGKEITGTQAEKEFKKLKKIHDSLNDSYKKGNNDDIIVGINDRSRTFIMK